MSCIFFPKQSVNLSVFSVTTPRASTTTAATSSPEDVGSRLGENLPTAPVASPAFSYPVPTELLSPPTTISGEVTCR
ncbi:hypothetical protein J6590_060152 [Homalodisca vitripennis]|nr:hypothetical protein J6590_060152 [Homalodisca vitripennis]